jgi:YbbR domain-containing protein
MNPLRYPGLKLLALLGAFLLWGVSHSTASVERGFDVPVVQVGVPENLVVVARTSDAVNVRVRGSRAALRSLSVGTLAYPVDLSGARPGVAKREVDLIGMDLPRGATVVSRSPLSIEFTLENRSSRAVRVRPDMEGEPAEGYVLGEVAVDPPRVRIAGARTEVLRLSEVLTETIDVSGAIAPLERRVRPSITGPNLWLEGVEEVTVRIDVQPVETEEEAE